MDKQIPWLETGAWDSDPAADEAVAEPEAEPEAEPDEDPLFWDHMIFPF
jgi:hypothetical protein